MATKKGGGNTKTGVSYVTKTGPNGKAVKTVVTTKKTTTTKTTTKSTSNGSVSLSVPVLVIQAGTQKTIQAQWKISGDKKKYTDHFEYIWQQLIGKTWNKGSEGNVDYSSKEAFVSTFTPGDNATAVRFCLRAVSKTHKVKKNGKETTEKYYATTKYTPWQEFKNIQASIVKGYYEIKSVNFDSSRQLPLNIVVAPYRSNKPSEQNDKWVVSFDVTWEFNIGGKYWQKGDQTTHHREERTIQYLNVIPDGTTQVRVVVTPTSQDPGVTAETRNRTENITKVERTIDKTSLKILKKPNANREVVATWKIGNKNNLEGFKYLFQAYDGVRWTSEKEGTVQYSHYSGDPKNDTTWYWTTDGYTVPDMMTSVRVTVTPTSSDTSGFAETSHTIDPPFKWTVSSNKINQNGIKLTILPTTTRTIVASWNVSGLSNVASCEYRWSYKVYDLDVLFVDSTGTVSADSPALNCQYTPGVNVSEVYFEVRPVPNYTNAFAGVWSEPVVYSFARDVKSISNLRVFMLDEDRPSRTVTATWAMEDKTNVSGYETKWRYYLYTDQVDNLVKVGESKTISDPDETSTSYSVPERAVSAEVTVRPIPREEGLFVGQWSNYESYQFVKQTRSIGDITIERVEDTDRTLRVSFEIDDEEHVDYYEYEYQTFSFGVWSDVTSGTTIRKAFLIEPDEQANVFEIRIKPVDTSGSESYFAGQFSGFASYNIDIPERSVRDINLSLQRGSTTTVVATWEIDDSENVASYSYKWRYNIDNIWYDGSEGSSSNESLVSTYDAPAMASMVEIKVTPTPEHVNDFKGVESEYAIFPMPSASQPSVPNVPNVTIKGYNVTATLESYDENSASFEFEIVNENSKWGGGLSDPIYNQVTYVFTVEAGHTYRVRARGLNEDGESSEWSNWSSEVSSMPSGLVNPPEVHALSATSVEILWEAVPGVDSYTIERANKSRYFDSAPDLVDSVTVTGVTRAEIQGLEPKGEDSSGEWFFRIKCTNDQGDSEWSEIVSIIVGTIPDPPTTWSSSMSAVVTEDLYLYWLHNSEDGSIEEKAILELNVNGESQEIEIENETPDQPVKQYLIEAGTYPAGAVIRWRVKTKGIVDDFGNWSTTRQVNLYAPPAISLTLCNGYDWLPDDFEYRDDNIYDSDLVDAPVVDGSLTYFPMLLYVRSSPPSQTPLTYVLTITANETYDDLDDTGRLVAVHAGDEIYSHYYYTDKHEFMTIIDASDLDLESGRSYKINLIVNMDSGLTAETNFVFSTDFTEDTDVYFNVEFGLEDNDAVAFITPTCIREDESLIEDVLVSVYRKTFDGHLVEIAKNLDNRLGTTVTDPHPTLDYARYRIVAKSLRTGRTYYYDVPSQTVGISEIIIQWDEEEAEYVDDQPVYFVDPVWKGSMIRLPFNIDESNSSDVDVEFVNYIGREHPVSYYGTHLGQTATWKTEIPKSDEETIYSLRRLASWPGDAYVRSPSGVGYWAQVKVQFDINHLDVLTPVTLSITRVEGGM